MQGRYQLADAGDGEPRVRAVQGHSGAAPVPAPAALAVPGLPCLSACHAALAPATAHKAAALPSRASCTAVSLKNPPYNPIRAPEEVPLVLHATSPERRAGAHGCGGMCSLPRSITQAQTHTDCP